MKWVSSIVVVVSVALCSLPSNLQAQSFSSSAGTDTFPSAAAVTLDLGDGCQGSILLTGPTTVRRGAPQRLQDGRDLIDTEIVSMELTGTDPVFGPVRLLGGSNLVGMASTGTVIGNSNTNDFPADSFFDVFVVIDVPQIGRQLINASAVRVQALIPRIPPISSTFTNLNQVALFDLQNPQQQLGTLVQVWHHPSRFGSEVKLGLSLNVTNGVLATTPVDLRVCPTNFLTSATVKIKRQQLTATLLVNTNCNEVSLPCDGPLVLQATWDRNLRAQDWRGHHRGRFRILCGTTIVATGQMEGCEGIGTHRDPLDRDCEPCADCSHFEGKLKGVILAGQSKGAKIEACYAGEFVDANGDPISCCPQPCLPPSGPLRMTIDGVVVHRCIPLVP